MGGADAITFVSSYRTRLAWKDDLTRTGRANALQYALLCSNGWTLGRGWWRCGQNGLYIRRQSKIVEL